MDSTYIPVLKQLLSRDEEESKELLEDFKEIVGTVINFASPLSINALNQLRDREQDELKCHLILLHSVLSTE